MIEKIFPVVKLYVSGKNKDEIVELLPEFTEENIVRIINIYRKYRLNVMNKIYKNKNLYDDLFHYTVTKQ